jgi:adenylate cyclase
MDSEPTPPDVPISDGTGNTLINAIADWLMEQALGSTSAEQLVEQCSLRLDAAGIPLYRSSIGFQILHPLYQAVSLIWYRESGLEEPGQFAGDTRASDTWTKSPLHYLVENNLPFLRRQLSGPKAQLDFELLEELSKKGATDYLAYVVRFDQDGFGRYEQNGIVGSWTSDRPGGFSDDEIQSLMRIQQRLAVACKMFIKEQITKNVLSAYLGPDAGEQVLKGQIKLGDGETTHAVIWFSDLRNSSGLADTLPPEEFIVLINEYFQCMAGAVLDSGGEVLRFIGDAVLAIFPIRDEHASDGEACTTALAAARDAVERMTALNKNRKADKKDALGFGIGLHVGDVMYGNIGVPERVEFSVVGPAANEAARLETLTKSLGHQVIFSDRFTSALDEDWQSLGKHELRGVGDPMEVFHLKDLGT